MFIIYAVYLIDPNTKKQSSKSAEYDKYRSTRPQQSNTAVSNPPAIYPSKSPHKESYPSNLERSSDIPLHETGNKSILSNLVQVCNFPYIRSYNSYLKSQLKTSLFKFKYKEKGLNNYVMRINGLNN